MRLRPLLFTLLLTLPVLAAAEQQTDLRLGDPFEQAQWNTVGLPPVTALPDGIRVITSAQKGTLSRPLALTYGVQVVTVYYTSPRGATLSFIWKSKGSPAGRYLQIPVRLNSSTVPTSMTVDLSAVQRWDPRAIAIGFQLPPGADITFHGVELQGWSVGEQLGEAMKCFWAFDGLKAHSINFFWGPLLCSTPVSLANLYRNQPPLAHSAMSVIYALLIVGAVVIAFRAWMKAQHRRRILLKCGALFFAFWLLLDIRMGAELIATWTYDVRSYLLEPVGVRTFRRLNFLPDFAAATRAVVAGESRYVLLVPTTNTFMNYMRYQTYPSQPVSPAAGQGTTVWLVYERPDLKISTDGRIVEDGVPISPPGQVTHTFMQGTFIFRVSTPPTPVPPQP